MTDQSTVLEYKCPCCEAGLVFDNTTQKLHCDSCGNDFEFEAVKEYNQMPEEDEKPDFSWDDAETSSAEEDLPSFTCPSCGGEIITDGTTVATFCPYCDNPVVIPGRASGQIRPDAVIPFQKSRKDAQEAFKQLCKGKLLLPKDYTSRQRLEQITGIYVPFWLYNCQSNQTGKYRATRVHTWSDSQYRYTKTDYFLLTRAARAEFHKIPMDASSKIDDVIMESIEPFDYSGFVRYDSAYMAGFLADKYDVEAKSGEEHIRSRVSNTMDQMIESSCVGYATCVPTDKRLKISHNQAKYVLLPVWMLSSKYKDKVYTFAMNAQTGKMVGTFPICGKKSAAWFSGIAAGAAALAMLIGLFL